MGGVNQHEPGESRTSYLLTPVGKSYLKILVLDNSLCIGSVCFKMGQQMTMVFRLKLNGKIMSVYAGPDVNP